MLGIITITVGQRESEDVREKDPGREMAATSTVEDIPSDRQEEPSATIQQVPTSESNLEEIAQPAEAQSNDVGFKKVFKFVGFKFTVKKDKNEKSDTVQLLTVKKDGGEGAEGSVGAGDHPGPSTDTEEPKESELKQFTEQPEDTPKPEQGSTEASPQAESSRVAEEEGKDEGEKPEKESAKSPESPTSPVTGETTSSFKKFFTHGWAGWRKKTSFRKPKEDELEASEKNKEQQEVEKAETEENEKIQGTPEGAAEPEQQQPAKDAEQARLSADYEKVELPLEEQGPGWQGSEEKCAPLATEVFDEKAEGPQEVLADVHVIAEREEEKEEEEEEKEEEKEKKEEEKEKKEEKEEEKEEEKPQEPEAAVEEPGESSPPEKLTETNKTPAEAEPVEKDGVKEVCASAEEHTQPTDDLSTEGKVPPKHPESIPSEADLLSSQERVKVQGSPLKKLFSSTGLKKLSGKKQKGKRGGGDEEPGEHQQVPTESPESADEQKGDSSASSPEEPEEITCLEKGLAEGPQEGREVEEGATSDGEKKREGITPWASFKKMVTPKKRVRRPSESDKEEELDKIKSATLSSTESATSDMQEEGKGVSEEQKPEEPKRKVDTSVSWEALICVGSSKKRARKASSSDDEGDRAEEAGKEKEAGADAGPAGSSQEQGQEQGNSSPEPAGSPTEGEGVSTWESFKRLVTPRKKSKSKLEEKAEDSGTEHVASDGEPGKEESWVSIKKFIPGRRKKRADGKQEQAAVDEAGPTDINEDDSDVPAVVPLSEYDAVEREKMEALQAQCAEMPQLEGAVYVSEEVSKTLVHTVCVTVIDGTRAVSSVEERSPSWISASVTEPLEQAQETATTSTREVIGREITAEEAPSESRDTGDDTVTSEVELTSEAVTAAEPTETVGVEEATEASAAEETTTDMVSAVSQLSDSPDTTEEATLVQEVDGGMPGTEEQAHLTQAILQAVAEKVKEESKLPGAQGPEDAIQTSPKAGPNALEKVVETEEDPTVLDVGNEKDVVSKDPTQGMDPDSFTQGDTIAQTTPESFEEVPRVTADTQPKGLIATCPDGKPQELLEQGGLPDSETLTDSETNGSTPIADLEVLDATLQSGEDSTLVTGQLSQATELEPAPARGEDPPAPPSVLSQEEKETPRMEDVLEPPEQALSPEAAPAVVSETEGVTETGQFADQDVRGVLCVEGLEASAHAQGTNQGPDCPEQISEVTEGAECQKSDSVELENPSLQEGEAGTKVDWEQSETKPGPESDEPAQEAVPMPAQQLAQPVDMPGSDKAEEASSLEGSSSLSDQQEVGCLEVQAQISEPSVISAAAVVEKVADTAQVSETGKSLDSGGAHITPAEQPSKTPQPRVDTAPLVPESQAELVPVIASASLESMLHSELKEDESGSQKQRSGDSDEQVGCAAGEVSRAKEGEFNTEMETLEYETESTKLVQNIIQTAVDQFVHAEEAAPKVCASDVQMQADQLGAQETLGKEERRCEGSTQGGEPVAAAQAASELASVRATLSSISTDVTKASGKVSKVEAKSASASDQQLEEVMVPPKAEGDGNIAKPMPGDSRAKSREKVEKPFESKEEEKGDSPAVTEHHSLALAHTDAPGGLTKECLDANGPKLTEEGDAQEVVQEGKVHGESDNEVKPQTEEGPPEPEGKPAKSEPADS